MRLNKLFPGLTLLCLLFFYDIFWVFGSKMFTKDGQSVMVEVATGIDAPIKLLMPMILPFDRPRQKCSLLGLGDIVIPGIYIGFLIRFGK
jgi:presenilin-like A22 family membrane protease